MILSAHKQENLLNKISTILYWTIRKCFHLMNHIKKLQLKKLKGMFETIVGFEKVSCVYVPRWEIPYPQAPGHNLASQYNLYRYQLFVLHHDPRHKVSTLTGMKHYYSLFWKVKLLWMHINAKPLYRSLSSGFWKIHHYLARKITLINEWPNSLGKQSLAYWREIKPEVFGLEPVVYPIVP